MAFDTVVFGLYIKGTGFTDGSSIETGGLRCFIKPTANRNNIKCRRYRYKGSRMRYRPTVICLISFDNVNYSFPRII
jgi:hypothetical protein